MQPAEAWAPVAERLAPPTVLLDHREHTFEGRLGEIAAAGEGAPCGPPCAIRPATAGW